MMEIKTVESENYKCWLQDGILHGIYKKDCIVTLDIAKKLVEMRLQLHEPNTSYPAIAYLLDEEIIFTTEARKYFCKEGLVGVTKMAIVTKSKLKAVIANIFIFLDRPIIPTKLFTNQTDALRWIHSEFRS